MIVQALKPLLEKHLQQAFQSVIEQDMHGEGLGALKRKRITLCLRPLPWPIHLHFAEPIEVVLGQELPADAKVKTSLKHLKALQEGANVTALIKSGELAVEGDLHCLQWLILFLQNIDIDLFEPLSQVIGDPLTYVIQRRAQATKNYTQHVYQEKKLQFEEYVQYESNWGVSSQDYQQFSSEVQAISKHIDALEVALEQFKSTDKG